MPTVLCIDDKRTGLTTRKALLESVGYCVLTAEDGITALSLLRAHHRIDAVVLDYRMPGMDGEALARIIRNEQPDLRIVLLSGYPLDLLPSKLVALADAVVIKGEPPQVLLTALERLTGMRPEVPHVKISRAVEEARKLREQSRAIRSESRALVKSQE